MTGPILTPAEEHIAFLLAIGQSITQWAHVENALFNICTKAFSDAPTRVVGASFFAIENFRTKLAFTDNAVSEANAFKGLLQEWVSMRELTSALSSVRNKIAHCRTITFAGASVGRRYAIVPISYKDPKFKSNKALPPSGSLCVIDIDLASRQFSRASNLLFELMAKSEGNQWLPAKYFQQEPQRRSLKEIRSLIDAVNLQRARLSPP